MMMTSVRKEDIMAKKRNDIGIACPYCDAVNDSVIIDSRYVGFGKRRRRKCNNCGCRFSTIERCLEKQSIEMARRKNDDKTHKIG